MAEDGDEKLLATVQHIVQTLDRTDTMTEDIRKVFSNYDGRLSLEKLYAPHAAAAAVGGAGEFPHHRCHLPRRHPQLPGSCRR
jgi:hypothetical protein